MSEHHHQPTSYNRAFIVGIVLNSSFVIIEATYGFLGNSIALLTDAGHNLGDVLGLVLAWGAHWLRQMPPSKLYTYGLRRSSIMAALLNATLLMLAMGAIGTEAIQRLSNPQPVAEFQMIGVALVGIVINTATALLFLSDREKDLNLKAAFWHMASDALVSVGVVLAGIGILVTNWLWFDPVVSLIMVVVIVFGTWGLWRDSVNLALDAVPSTIEPLAVRTYLSELPGVVAVHDIHIWAMSTTDIALTAHLVMPTGNPGDAFLTRISLELHQNFDIDHTTIQVETGNSLLPCQQKHCNC